MSIGIYKIQNQINGKIYIGQSIHIEQRWKEHCQAPIHSLIAQAIHKYGKENFTFEIIEECSVDDLDKLEEQYIRQYNSLAPNGYNIMLTSATKRSCFANYDIKTFYEIISDIKNSTLSFQEIADKYNLDRSMIYYLNRGDYHTMPDLQYPLREVRDFSKKHHYCVDCGMELKTNAERCQKSVHLALRKTEWPDRETLKKKIRGQSFTAISKEYKVSEHTICRWCRYYNLPSKRSIINTISDEDWAQI